MASCMECIHFNPCNSNKSIVVKKQTEANEWGLHNSVENECKYFTHTADVVPKSEVEKLEEYIDDLNDSKEHLCVMLEEARVELEAMRTAANSYKMHYNNLAREIFDEMGEECFDQFGFIDYEALAELKIKYTEEYKDEFKG